MKPFKKFLVETSFYKVDKKGNQAGIVHELLVGKCLNNGKDMELYPDDENTNPRDALKEKWTVFNDAQQKKLRKRAKKTCDEIKAYYKKQGCEIMGAHWTSVRGQIGQTTGIEDKLDDSDIVISKKCEGSKKICHAGVSLKAYEKNRNTINVSNNTSKILFSDKEIKEFREILQTITEGKSGKGPKEQEAYWEANPDKWGEANVIYGRLKKQIQKNIKNKLAEMSGQQLSNYIRKLIHAEKTAMEADVCNDHIRVNSFGIDENSKVSIVNPGSYYEGILNAIAMHPELVTFGEAGDTGVILLYNGHRVVNQTIKINSKTNFFNALVSICELYMDIPPPGEGYRKGEDVTVVVKPEEEEEEESMEIPIIPTSDVAGSNSFYSTLEIQSMQGKTPKSKAKRKIVIPNVKTTGSKQKIKAAIEQSFKGDSKQAPAPKATGNDIWAQIEKKYTTTHDSYEEISKVFGKSVEEIDSHRRNGNWHRPPRKIAV
jgi:hypothetical protein